MDTLRQPETYADRMLGNSPKMQELRAQVRRVAVTDLPVLLVGEKGTGRSLAARTIHELGSRRGDPFTRIECSFVSEDDLISALSRGGSLFLNRVDALPLPLQAALVRHLDEKAVTRVGVGNQATNGPRLITATDQDLTRAIGQGTFLDGLYSGFVMLRVPALRERVSDILLLADAFMRSFANGYGKQLIGFSQGAQDAVMAYAWPGNVRELQHRIMHAVALAEGFNITPRDLELGALQEDMSLQQALEAFEKQWIAKVLVLCKNNITQTANKLGVTRPTLYDLMRKLGLPRR